MVGGGFVGGGIVGGGFVGGGLVGGGLVGGGLAHPLFHFLVGGGFVGGGLVGGEIVGGGLVGGGGFGASIISFAGAGGSSEQERMTVNECEVSNPLGTIIYLYIPQIQKLNSPAGSMISTRLGSVEVLAMISKNVGPAFTTYGPGSSSPSSLQT